MRGFRWIGIELVEVSITEKLVAGLGSAFAVFTVFAVCRLPLPGADSVCVIASMGASAVLLYAVPHGPLSQPWPLFGGHVVSALIGVVCAKWISDPSLAAAIAVGISIGAMHQLKCIHPPGGATAFTAVMGGDELRELGFGYLLYPVLLNVLAMFVLAVVINYAFPWRRYPATLTERFKATRTAGELDSDSIHEEVVAALRSIDSFVDVSEEDLLYLTRALVQKVGGAAVETCEATVRQSESSK